MRRFFTFLFEFIFKSEDEALAKKGGARSQLPSNQFEELLKRRLQKWQNKPWILPEFLKIKKPLFIGAGDKIQVKADIDAARIQACKSKKAKGVYELMKTIKTQSSLVTAYADGSNMIGY